VPQEEAHLRCRFQEPHGGFARTFARRRLTKRSRELRKAEVQLRRRPTSGSSATEDPPPPRPPYALMTLSQRGSGDRVCTASPSLGPSQFYSPSTVLRDEDPEAHRRAFCTLNG
jgi:hypothetical protein